MPVRVALLGEQSVALGERFADLPAALDLRVVGRYVDSADARSAMQASVPDVAIVSPMREQSGFDFIAATPHSQRPSAIVFVSSREEDAVRAFELQATDFVPSPVDAERLAEAMIRARHHVLQAALLRTADELQRLLGEVITVEALSNGVSRPGLPPCSPGVARSDRTADGAPSYNGRVTAAWSATAGTALRERPSTDRAWRESEETVLDLSAMPQRSATGIDVGSDGNGSRPLRVLVREGRRTRFVPLSEVDWFEADGNYIIVHAADKTYRTRGTISAIEGVLDPRQFVRIHRRMVVNMDRVREMTPLPGGDGLLMLGDGSTLRLSRTYRARVR